MPLSPVPDSKSRNTFNHRGHRGARRNPMEEVLCVPLCPLWFKAFFGAMMKHLRWPLIAALCAIPVTATAQGFQAAEATISEIHAAMAAGRLTCRELVSQYLARITAYDKAGPAINAIVVVN